jgi:hypothetical protein
MITGWRFNMSDNNPFLYVAANDPSTSIDAKDMTSLLTLFQAQTSILPGPSNDRLAFPRLEDILQELQIRPNQEIENAAIAHVYKCVCLSPAFRVGTPKEDIEALTQQILGHFELRYNIFTTYEEDFFRGKKYDRDALLMAVILDEFITRPIVPTSDRVSSAFERAIPFYLAAEEITEDGLEDDDAPDLESWFLASINTRSMLNSMRENFYQFDQKQLRAVEDDFFHIAGSIVKHDTAIGLDLYKTLDQLSFSISDLTPKGNLHGIYRPMDPDL